MKRIKRHKVKTEKEEPSTSSIIDKEEHDLAYYIHDRVELVHQVFSVLKYREIKAMAPNCIRNLAVGDLQELCTEELLGISSKRLLAILDGAEPPSDTESSSQSMSPDNLETISLDSISSDDEILSQDSGSGKKKKHKHRRRDSKSSKKDKSKDKSSKEKAKKSKTSTAALENEQVEMSKASRAGLTVLELLELQARARAIRAQLQNEHKASDRQSESDRTQAVGSEPSDTEVMIKEEPQVVVEILSSDDEMNKEEKTDSQKPTEVQSDNSVTKRVNNLIITVPQTKNKRKIKLNRNKPNETTNNVSNEPTNKTITVDNSKNDENSTKTTKTVDISTKNNDNPSKVVEKDTDSVTKKKKQKKRKKKDKKDIDEDEITLQLSDTEKMDLLEDLEENRQTDSSSDSSSSSSETDDEEKTVKNKNDTSVGKNTNLERNSTGIEKDIEKRKVTGTQNINKSINNTDKDSTSIEKSTIIDEIEESTSENTNKNATESDNSKESSINENTRKDKIIEITKPDQDETSKNDVLIESNAKETHNIQSDQTSKTDATDSVKTDNQTDQTAEKSDEELPTEVVENNTNNKEVDTPSTSNDKENETKDNTRNSENEISITQENTEKVIEITTIDEISIQESQTSFQKDSQTLHKDKPSQSLPEKGKHSESDDDQKSEGELSDRLSSDIEAVDLKPEVVCISDDETKTKKKKDKKRKKDKKEKKKKKDKKQDFREGKDENFYKENIDIVELSDEILELSDDSSCYEVEGILSKEPTAEEIAALSARIDEIQREDVVTDEQIRLHEAEIAKIDNKGETEVRIDEKEVRIDNTVTTIDKNETRISKNSAKLSENENTETEIENVSWKDRYLDSKKVKKVLSTANIVNALRKKNIQLKKRIAESKKVAELKEIEEEQKSKEKEIENNPLEGSIDQYNTLQGSTRYIDPVKDPSEVTETTSELTKTTSESSKTNSELNETANELTHEMIKDAKQLLKMYKKLLKYNDMEKKKDPNKRKKKRIKKKVETKIADIFF